MSAPAVETTVPQRRRIAVGRKTGRNPFVVELATDDATAAREQLDEQFRRSQEATRIAAKAIEDARYQADCLLAARR
ncbi:hypothetical protein [Streptomyces sp. NPDC096030]|uniref:hypothetical protein n=1 Tax=Streptomyces sp. NPDC096030 TaxID=3155423 RepID=UPI0033310328